mmetsp:Transcript_8658/g.8588  ORF Transcript_8658/g.8588 Transcript_8658/m.8588 type:complete len:560 (-) Transcript_8658:67-1746(-)
MHMHTLKATTDALILDKTLLCDVVKFCETAACALMTAFQERATPGVSTSGESWRMLPSDMNQAQRDLLQSLPEHLVDDIVIILIFVSKVHPACLSTSPLDNVLNLVVFFLRRPWAVQSPHLRAQLGSVLYQVFIPHKERGNGSDSYTGYPQSDGPHSSLLSSNLESQQFLAPALLLLYGDVENTGFYDKLPFRRSIMAVLKHLWSLSTHRAAFRGIALNTAPSTTPVPPVSGSDVMEVEGVVSNRDGILPEEGAGVISMSTDDDEENYFLRFANGLMNETNFLVSSIITELAEIKKIQVRMASPEWGLENEDEKKRILSQFQDAEGLVKQRAGLCLETLNMFTYLTSDEVIRGPFLMDTILPRFTSMLLNVLSKLDGSKGMEIKVENMDKYNFNPRAMLSEVCQSMAHFVDFEAFWSAIANDGFYEDGKPLKSALNTVSKLGLISGEQARILQILVEHVNGLKGSIQDMEALTAAAPEEFLCGMLYTLMRDPVRLPTSKNIVDRSFIAQHLLNEQNDPYNRLPLTMKMIEPLPGLKARIEAYINGTDAPASESTPVIEG